MDAFERNKYNEDDYVKQIIANSVIVSYGFITSIDLDTVTVTLSVSDRTTSEKVNCVFMDLGSEEFSISYKPAVGMRVIVLAPNKAAAGMFESYDQINATEGRPYILTDSPSVYSSQFAVCFPLMKSTVQALSSLLIDSGVMTLEMSHDLIANIDGSMSIEISEDTDIEFDEDTNHTRDYFGNLIETFGMLEGISGAEKPGTYTYEETYGKYSSVTKNYESGFTTVIGKSYPTPFLANKGTPVDSSAPVTINLGTGAPVTLTFGNSVMTIKADTTHGLDIEVTGSVPVKIVAGAGMLKIGNSNGTLKDAFDAVLDIITNLTTAGSPSAQATDPATKAIIVTKKALIESIFD